MGEPREERIEEVEVIKTPPVWGSTPTPRLARFVSQEASEPANLAKPAAAAAAAATTRKGRIEEIW